MKDPTQEAATQCAALIEQIEAAAGSKMSANQRAEFARLKGWFEATGSKTEPNQPAKTEPRKEAPKQVRRGTGLC